MRKSLIYYRSGLEKRPNILAAIAKFSLKSDFTKILRMTK